MRESEVRSVRSRGSAVNEEERSTDWRWDCEVHGGWRSTESWLDSGEETVPYDQGGRHGRWR